MSDADATSPELEQRWSIAARTTWWFALTTAVLVLAICGTSGMFVYRSLSREVDALALEELHELTTSFGVTARTDEDLDRIARELDRKHPANPMAWRVWDKDGAVCAQAGHVGMLSESVPARAPQDHVQRLPGDWRWCSTRLDADHTVGVVLDGSAQIGTLARLGWLSIMLAGVSGVIAFVAGALFIRRACNLLRRVTDKVRCVHTTSDSVDLSVPGAPEEIREVVDAVSHALDAARNESARTRLLTTGLAHELGSPIQNLIGETEVALMSERTNEAYKRVLQSHLEELHDIGRAVGNLMTLCSISEQRSPGDVEEFDLGREASLRLRREHAHAKRRGVHLDVAASGDLSLIGDREALLLALSNLVANAIDWSPAGADVRVALEGSNGAVEITVDDHGPGVPPEERDKIFEAFYRGPAAAGRRAGYGLGLSIAKKAVESHGGDLRVASSPFGGARFTLQLPRAPEPGTPHA